MTLRSRFSIDELASDCYAIRRTYSDGVVVTLGTYRTLRDARAELRAIREND